TYAWGIDQVHFAREKVGQNRVGVANEADLEGIDFGRAEEEIAMGAGNDAGAGLPALNLEWAAADVARRPLFASGEASVVRSVLLREQVAGQGMELAVTEGIGGDVRLLPIDHYGAIVRRFHTGHQRLRGA